MTAPATTTPRATVEPRVLFAHQLRGVAALLVVVCHLLGVFFSQEVVAGALGTSPLELARPAWTTWFFRCKFDPGPGGVALFFLISGFVIPFGLRRLSAGPFLLSRALRIYPTYWTCLAIGMFTIFLLGNPAEVQGGLTAPRLLSNALLVFGHTGQPSLDLVNWTLAIEIKFYLLASLFAVPLMGKSFWPTLWLSLGCLFAVAVCSHPGVALDHSLWSSLLRGLASDLPYVIYMLIGTLFYKNHLGCLSKTKLILQMSSLLLLFTLAWACSPGSAQFPQVTWNYYSATALFGLAYVFRKRCRPSPLLDSVAAISFPLYAVHSLVSYALLQHLLRSGWSYNQALPPVLVLILCLAGGLHVLVETPSQKAGRRWAASWQTRKARRGEAELCAASPL